MAMSARSGPVARVGRASIVLLGLACGGTGRATPSSVGTAEQEQPGGTPGGTDVAGGQTTDFGGVEVGCRVQGSEAISAEAARARGFPVDADLELLQSRFEAEWQRRPSSCEDTRASSGTLVFRVELAGLYVEHHESEPYLECPDTLAYVVRVDLTSSDGLISGSFEARGTREPDELLFFGLDDARRFGGWLGIRVDRARPHSSQLSVSLASKPSAVAGSLYTLVSYSDGLEPAFQPGESIIWPPQAGELPCSASGDEPGDGSELIPLDDYLSGLSGE
jgi:hypothetical protein